MKEGKEDWAFAYSEWRNAPTGEGHSPAQFFYGRQVRSCILPELIKMLDVQKMAENQRQQEANKRYKRVTRYQAKPAGKR